MIAQGVESTHKAICRAGFLVVMMLVRRRFIRADAVEAVERLKFATSELERLIASSGSRVQD